MLRSTKGLSILRPLIYWENCTGKALPKVQGLIQLIQKNLGKKHKTPWKNTHTHMHTHTRTHAHMHAHTHAHWGWGAKTINKQFIHGRNSFPGGSMVKSLPANTGDTGDMDLIPGLGRSPEGGNGNPFPYSCLENAMDRGAWWAIVHGVTKSWTWLSTAHNLYPFICHWTLDTIIQTLYHLPLSWLNNFWLIVLSSYGKCFVWVFSNCIIFVFLL